jgi:hypothetical protein
MKVDVLPARLRRKFHVAWATAERRIHAMLEVATI